MLATKVMSYRYSLSHPIDHTWDYVTCISQLQIEKKPDVSPQLSEVLIFIQAHFCSSPFQFQMRSLTFNIKGNVEYWVWTWELFLKQGETISIVKGQPSPDALQKLIVYSFLQMKLLFYSCRSIHECLTRLMSPWKPPPSPPTLHEGDLAINLSCFEVTSVTVSGYVWIFISKILSNKQVRLKSYLIANRFLFWRCTTLAHEYRAIQTFSANKCIKDS